jgi:hypothetical protein
MIRPIALTSLVFLPTPVLAFDFGFVRGPDWMDAYLIPLMVVFAITFGLTLVMKPRGVPVNQMYRHFSEFSAVGRLIYAFSGLAFFVIMGFVFLGMGLQRAAEAGF